MMASTPSVYRQFFTPAYGAMAKAAREPPWVGHPTRSDTTFPRITRHSLLQTDVKERSFELVHDDLRNGGVGSLKYPAEAF